MDLMRFVPCILPRVLVHLLRLRVCLGYVAVNSLRNFIFILNITNRFSITQIRWLVDRAYDWFARNRHWLIRRRDGQPPCELCVPPPDEADAGAPAGKPR